MVKDEDRFPPWLCLWSEKQGQEPATVMSLHLPRK